VPGIGARLRQARLKAGLTQQRLAGDRYTKAYVSALENGLVNPSMVALEYLASRLGTSASQLIANDQVGWRRLEADLLLASGQLEEAADAYAGLLPTIVDPTSRADILRNSAEALARLFRLDDAAAHAAEALELYQRHGNEEDVARSSFWLGIALQLRGDFDEARAVLLPVLERVRAGLLVEPDFLLRLVMALARIDSARGDHETALAYFEEIQSLSEQLDDRRRGDYLLKVALGHRERGDYEAALRAGYGSRALLNAARAEVKMATVEKDLAISHLAVGDSKQAAALAQNARDTFERMDDQQLLAEAIEAQARIRAADGDAAGALGLARESLELAQRSGNQQAAVDALLTTARIQASLDDDKEAGGAYEAAADLARRLGRPDVVRRALTEWADHLARRGDHRAAFELTREALGSSRGPG
jgi:tetratricopeptide (TPR) repeat protein